MGKELENAKDAAHDAVMERIGSETTIEQAQIIIKEIKRDLRSMGLKEIVIGSDVNGERPILAEASSLTRIGALVAHHIRVGVSASDWHIQYENPYWKEREEGRKTRRFA